MLPTSQDDYAIAADLYDYVVPYLNRPDVAFYVDEARSAGGPVLAAVFKYFKLPKEGMRFSIRAEAFNSTNRVNFGAPSLSLATPTAFGEVATPTTARVMQFAGRLDF